MSTTPLLLTDLPTDILLDIVPYLGVEEFLALCATCQTLATLRLDPSYWRRLTRSTYRFPNQPLLQTDGARWKSLYQRLRTESRAYTWGLLGRLGHSWSLRGEIPRQQHHQWANRGFPVGSGFAGIGWPTEMEGTRRMKPIVDLQCGGYSTTVLDSEGDLFCTGTVDGSRGESRHATYQLKRLLFPAVLPLAAPRTAHTTVAQFSSGRSHLLALSDSGCIWVWRSVNVPARQVQFLHFDTREDPPPTCVRDGTVEVTPEARVKKVVAGWDTSSAYITTKGIVVWQPPPSPRPVLYPANSNLPGPSDETEGGPVESATVPDTWYQRPRGTSRASSVEEAQLARTVGEVVNHVALEGYIVFLTDLGKVFTAKHAEADQLSCGIVELTGFEPVVGTTKMTEIQGSFRSFAVLNPDGDVILGDRTLLDEAWHEATDGGTVSAHPYATTASTTPQRPAHLQGRGIVSLAFGDWHTLALTAAGHILSFGRAPQSCGCLGLGRWDEGSVLRGVRTRSAWPMDSDLVDELQAQGRRIWFSPESREWLKYLMRSGMDPDELSRIAGRRPYPPRHITVSQWVEQKGSDWDLHEDLDDASQPWGRGQPSYLALSISAAGWHSGALVLTNEHRIRQSYLAHRGFLPHGDDEVAPVEEGVLSSAWRWLGSWWWGSEADELPAISATEDQSAGRDHAYYHSQQSIEQTMRHLPPAARHAVRLPPPVDGS
ncbi:MAG: hypothetical protein M1838_003470 [Thelocarpon superellum]|nr:MAG: hypothetical protein M1838_003470 [Thelocarpon superellum]